MTDNILQCGKFFLFFGSLCKKHFDIAPIWCEYEKPSELNDIDVSDEWIQLNLFDRLNDSEERAYYATREDIDYSKREFINVFCELSLNRHKLQGYIYAIDGEINSVSIFLGDNVVDLFSSNLLSEDNKEALNDISEYLKTNMTNVDIIEFKIQNGNTLKSNGKFHFPIEGIENKSVQSQIR